ncbi:hypothetical protein L4D09_08130 [Photobacterium makurazakiensis]|uniref:NAD(P)-dependent oxidoreductase n=1 Tax=Photobacterium makurazakiensis TaxID=2910234 RepID=UPI003D0A75A7
MNIYVHPVLDAKEAEYLQQQLPEHVTCYFNNGSHDFNLAKDADIAIGNFSTDWIADMPNLKTILLDSVGTDNFNHYQWPDNSSVTVCNLHGFFSVAVAEEILASIMSVYRQLPALHAAKEQAIWAKDTIRFNKRLIAESRVLVLGFGSIGQQAASLLSAFGATVNAFDASDMQKKGKQGLIEAVANHDILVSTIPATAASTDLIDRHVLAAMPEGATLVNVGRGQVINEDDLVAKAQSDRHFSACLDVTKQEPLPPSSLLWATPNIYLTQHTGGGSSNENNKKIDVYIKQIHRLLVGEPLQNTVSF